MKKHKSTIVVFVLLFTALLFYTNNNLNRIRERNKDFSAIKVSFYSFSNIGDKINEDFKTLNFKNLTMESLMEEYVSKKSIHDSMRVNFDNYSGLTKLSFIRLKNPSFDLLSEEQIDSFNNLQKPTLLPAQKKWADSFIQANYIEPTIFNALTLDQ